MPNYILLLFREGLRIIKQSQPHYGIRFKRGEIMTPVMVLSVKQHARFQIVYKLYTIMFPFV